MATFGKQTSTSPGAIFVAVTKSDATVLDPTRGLYVGGTGNVTIKDMAGNIVELVAPALGVIHPIQCTQVRAATTATSIVAVY